MKKQVFRERYQEPEEEPIVKDIKVEEPKEEKKVVKKRKAKK